MVGTQQDTPLGFWDKRIEYQISKNRTVQKIRNDLIKEQLRYKNKTRKQKSK